MKTKFNLTIAVVSVALLSSAVALAQKIKVDDNQPRLLLSANQIETLQQELDQAGAKGFHVVLGTSRGNSEIVLLLERNLNAAEQHQFKVIATNATTTFQQEVGDIVRQGYRAVAFMNKPGFLGIGTEIVVVMERPVNPSRYYEYKLLSTSQTSTLESEWRAAAGEGYTTVGALPRNEVMVLMEREAKRAASQKR
jgi:hypothetical protein